MEYLGRDGAKTLFVTDKFGVVVDELSNQVIEVASRESLTASAEWDVFGEDPTGSASELANAAVTDLDIKVFSDNDRMYTIPDAVVAEAKRGLAWRKEEGRGGTSVGLNSARTLAKGGQIGIRKVRHIAKYFPRHQVDKKGKGYKPGQDNYPSNGRIAWALWGGDAAERWASAIVERENKKAGMTAAVYYVNENSAESFGYEAFTPIEHEPDFYIRIRLDGSGIDRLYKVDEDGSCRFWDDGCWDDMGNVEHDFETYDKAMDDAYDKVKKIHLPVDRETAIQIAAMLDNNPMESVFLKKINFDETDLFEKAMPELDYKFMDQLSDDSIEDEDYWDEDGLMASVSEFAEAAPAGSESVTLPSTVDTTPGVYTDEERAENAATQVRDKLGRFAVNGSRVVIGGDFAKQGTITSQNPANGTVTVQMDNGSSVEVPGNTTQEISTFEPVSTANFPQNNLDFSGILGEPRAPIDEPLAMLPGRLPALTAPAVNTLINDWGAFVGAQRLTPEYVAEPAPETVYQQAPDLDTAFGEYYQGAFDPQGNRTAGWNPAVAANMYNNPNLRDWLDKNFGSSKSSPEYLGVGGWYKESPVRDAKKTASQVQKDRPEYEKIFDEKNFAALTAAGEDIALTPETSDIPPIYMAIVAEDDPAAVMELVSLVPASTKSSTPTTFVRRNQKWERNDRVMADLNSPTPPPVVVLSNPDLSEVLKQVDGGVVTASIAIPLAAALSNNALIAAIQAAGGADRNRGNAEKLRRYWTTGKGGLKIRWGSPGDWTRCHKQLAKYLGPRSKGYCALRHKEMTGVWPGDKNNVGRKKKSLRASAAIETLKPEEQVIGEFTLRARAEAAKSRMVGREGVVASEYGSRFTIPLVIPEGTETGDGRIFEPGAISMRDLPLPLLWQIKTGAGHDGSVVVGQITHMERVDGGIGNAYGVFDKGEYGQEAERLVRHGFIRGVSADMDKFEADEEVVEESTGDDSEDTKKIESGRINIKNARVMAVTIVPKPAFQECFIQIIEEGAENQEEDVLIPDGVYVDGVNPLDASAIVACGMVAGAIPTNPPSDWFNNPKLTKATPLTITDEGKVFGHIAAWHVDHIGMAYGTRPPRSRSKYSYFHTGVIRTDDGADMPVGQLTLAGGHAGLEASAEEAVRHYDDTASAFADVHAGEDAYGIWVSGALRPGTTPEQIRAARASAPSGDWRPIKGALELVAVCQVNVPGFPIARARVASGQVMALVAAGASTLAQLKHDPLAELSAKINNLEAAQKAPLFAAAEEARSKFASLNTEILAKRQAELATKVNKTKKEIDADSDYMHQMMDDDTDKELAVVSRRVRQRLAQEGKALKDGSFPIRNVSDLRNAVQAYGRAKPGSKGAVRKHIMKQARALNRKDLIPETWKVASSEFTIDDMTMDLRERIEFTAKSANLEALFEKDVLTAAAVDDVIEDLTPEEIEAIKQEAKAEPKKADTEAKYTPETQPRDAQGKFRQVLARLKQNLGTSGLQRVVEKVEEAENLDNAGNYKASVEAAGDLIGIIDRLDAKALNPDSLENIRNSSAELGKVIANLPFAFGEDASKIRFSDVPPALQDLMEDMIKKVEDKIGKEDADIATKELKGFMSGADYYNQSEISSQMSKLLRLLT
jgi:hypothetical protein